MAEPIKRKYKSVDELYIGMEVAESQLSEIYDTYIILTNVKDTLDDLIGTIGFIGKEITKEVENLRNPLIPITSIYNNSAEIGEDITYDE